MSLEVYGYTRLKSNAIVRLDYPSGKDDGALRGIGFAILALAEALRPEPTRVTLTVNTDEVKAAVVDALEGQR